SVPFKFIPDVEISGDYSEESVSTYTSKVRDRKGLSVHFESIDLSFGNTRYAVTPYAYWARNGALVLDYAVKPELPPNPADPATWWSERYAQQPDAAFILPWRYDPEKGLGISEEAQRFRTRDIIFDSALPSTGDVVTIQARVQNFSLVPTTGPVKVSFFIGDPDEGGVPMINTSGQTDVSTETIQDRGNSVVEFEWRVPETIGRFSRIYAVLDPDGTMPEIHESNNKGWTVLEVKDGLPTSVDENREAQIPIDFRLEQNYPNPFNPATTISYSLPKDSNVKLTVFDILGREVEVLVNRRQPAGQYRLSFEASRFPSGLYFYRIAAGGFQETRKMLLVK
ncbi:MAG: T9SS type A sorting domain-containing protein, partial [Calditrichaeota bacterium]|nr:T9SS type A sorting domain-containing protein [Calditrichota bacterium]